MAKRKKKQRKSKAQQEYERVRARLLRRRSRAEKAGSKYYFDLAPTPKQLEKQRGDKATAKVYREAAKGLKEFEKVYKGVLKREKDTQTAPLIDVSMDVITSFLQGLDWPTANGGHVIIRKTWEYVNKYGAEKVAIAINDMQDAQDLIGSAEFYNAEYGTSYMARMGLRLRQMNKLRPEEMIALEDRLLGSVEMVPDELAAEYYSYGRPGGIDELIEEFDLL